MKSTESCLFVGSHMFTSMNRATAIIFLHEYDYDSNLTSWCFSSFSCVIIGAKYYVHCVCMNGHTYPEVLHVRKKKKSSNSYSRNLHWWITHYSWLLMVKSKYFRNLTDSLKINRPNSNSTSSIVRNCQEIWSYICNHF